MFGLIYVISKCVGCVFFWKSLLNNQFRNRLCIIHIYFPIIYFKLLSIFLVYGCKKKKKIYTVNHIFKRYLEFSYEFKSLNRVISKLKLFLKGRFCNEVEKNQSNIYSKTYQQNYITVFMKILLFFPNIFLYYIIIFSNMHLLI